MTTNIQASTIRPGILVGLRTSVSGNVTYSKKVIEAGRTTESGEHIAEWETIRTITDRAEHDRAVKVRSVARSFLTKICVQTGFGLLCPEVDGPDLVEALAKAKAVCAEFNKDSKFTTVSFNAIMGRVAQDDVEAVKAINAEVRDLLADMKEGIQNLDVDAVRDAATKATQIGAMLSPDAQARITVAITAARETATKIKRAGDQAAAEIDNVTLRKLTEVRAAFLDLDETGEAAAPTATGRAVDFTPETAPEVQAAPARQPELV